jgi:hypothetical protein
MPKRTITVDGHTWDVMPSGFTPSTTSTSSGSCSSAARALEREVRVTRYSPHGTRSRQASLAEMPEPQLVDLFRSSQPSEMSPETGYRA